MKIASLLLLSGIVAFAAEPTFVRPGSNDPRYLELSDGSPYIPVGLNLIAPSGQKSSDAGLAQMDEWIGKLAAHGGNYLRVWLSSPFWDVETGKSGVYEEDKAKRIDQVLSICRKHGVRVKFTMEHFRAIDESGKQPWARKDIHHVTRGGPAKSMDDFYQNPASREQFKRKLAWFQKRYGSDPTVYGWELWNEIDAVRSKPESWMPWTQEMLFELHRLFPKNMAMQSLGSYDAESKRGLYREHSLLPGNDTAQVHRYLDLGARWPICHGPVDVIAAQAVTDLLSFNPGRPVILAESGAVEPSHTGPFKYYGEDRAGTILHDVLFAPFFAGAAGPGQIWHWDVYVAKNDLWWHFGRFAESVRGVDPAAERFRPLRLDTQRSRVYALAGNKTALMWVRDKEADWRFELERKQLPALREGESVDLTGMLRGAAPVSVRGFDPWSGEWAELPKSESVRLPGFRRSYVLRVTLSR
jgi:hypothetical protein